MAKRTITVLQDDLDGSDATETVSFAVDGVSYEIDLNDDNAARLRDDLAVWTAHATRVGGRRRTGSSAASAPRSRRPPPGRTPERDRAPRPGGLP